MKEGEYIRQVIRKISFTLDTPLIIEANYIAIIQTPSSFRRSAKCNLTSRGMIDGLPALGGILWSAKTVTVITGHLEEVILAERVHSADYKEATCHLGAIAILWHSGVTDVVGYEK